MIPKNTLCLWFDGTAAEAAAFYAATFPDSAVGAVIHAPGDYPDGKAGDVLVSPDLSDVGFLDFDKHDEAIRAGGVL